MKGLWMGQRMALHSLLLRGERNRMVVRKERRQLEEDLDHGFQVEV